MFVTKSGAVVGSLDVTKLAELADAAGIATDDLTPDQIATAINECAVDSGDDGDESPEEDEEEDLSKLYKAELVERAEAAGIDTAGMSKAEIVEALEGAGSEDT